jgi:hypothetical protein
LAFVGWLSDAVIEKNKYNNAAQEICKRKEEITAQDGWKADSIAANQAGQATVSATTLVFGRGGLHSRAGKLGAPTPLRPFEGAASPQKLKMPAVYGHNYRNKHVMVHLSKALNAWSSVTGHSRKVKTSPRQRHRMPYSPHETTSVGQTVQSCIFRVR